MNSIFKNLSKGGQLAYLIGLALLSLVIFGVLSVLLIHFVFGVSLIGMTNFSSIHDVKVIDALKMSQIIDSIALFIIPVLVFAYTTKNQPLRFLNLDRKPDLRLLLLVFLIMFTLYPFLNWMTAFNSEMHLPSFLSGVEHWMRMSETRADNVTKLFLAKSTVGQFILNLFMIAIIPAIAEELMFRGVLQRLFSEITNNVHWGVIITAFIFSAVHLQFFGFLPRFFLGLLLGYLYVLSRSIWVNIFAHFVNNGAVVIASYFITNTQTVDKISNYGSQELIPIILSILVSALVFWRFIYLCKQKGYSSLMGY